MDTKDPVSRRRTRRAVLAATAGNTLEWYDLTTYGFFAVPISKAFFPSGDPTVSLMLAFGTFGVSYLVRPLGALVLGTYADRTGRKAALLLTIRLMLIGTLLIALMPTYASIGIAAPVLILLARLIQGFSAGGEFGSATAFLAEQTPDRRGFMASWQFASQGFATLLAATFGTVLTMNLSGDQLNSWGWRLPFLFGLLIGPVGYLIRRNLPETPEFVEASDTGDVTTTPVRRVLRDQKLPVLLMIGALVMSTAVTYVIVYMPTYAENVLGLPSSAGFIGAVASGVALTTVTPLAGHLSDRFGRVRVMLIAAAAMMLSVYPLFLLLTGSPSLLVMGVVMFLIGLLKACYFGALPALMSEAFPTATRSTGLSLSYNIGVMSFGGFAPVIITWMISTTGNRLSPGFYILATGALSISALLAGRRLLALR
ncbi:MFS transporter [Streptomyces coffeae]|uniref:MFS transporter n=1 Tax=Streptomyces coffeae TaxID=621382 RepID=A0ABS1NES6_9ACTN|nr:MFS transporter [Streptomyces coffeae]MBL1098601.1 MFS transporter [Streptomyces coffeae]